MTMVDVPELPLTSEWTKCSAGSTERRYYAIRCHRNLFGEWEVIRYWGRLGQRGGSSRTISYASFEQACSAYSIACRQRVKRHYTLRYLSDYCG